MDITIGAPVFAVDGRVGTVDKIVVDPNTRRVTHLVLRRGFLLAEDRVVPIELVDRATNEGIYLRVTSQELKREPRYDEHDLVAWPLAVSPPAGYSRDDIRVWAPPLPGTPPLPAPVVEQDGKNILVETTDGRVIPGGKIHSWFEREEAERAGWSEPGVREVENHMYPPSGNSALKPNRKVQGSRAELKRRFQREVRHLQRNRGKRRFSRFRC